MNNLFQIKNNLEPELILAFKIDAEKSKVYDAWTQLETFKKWFLPTGFTIAKAELNAVEGGFFRVHMQSPEGEIYPTKGEYILLEKPNRIVYKDSWDDDRANNEAVISEVLFEANGNTTTLKLYASFATEKQKEETLASGIVDGWKMFLNNLNAVLNP